MIPLPATIFVVKVFPPLRSPLLPVPSVSCLPLHCLDASSAGHPLHHRIRSGHCYRHLCSSRWPPAGDAGSFCCSICGGPAARARGSTDTLQSLPAPAPTPAGRGARTSPGTTRTWRLAERAGWGRHKEEDEDEEGRKRKRKIKYPCLYSNVTCLFITCQTGINHYQWNKKRGSMLTCRRAQSVGPLGSEGEGGWWRRAAGASQSSHGKIVSLPAQITHCPLRGSERHTGAACGFILQLPDADVERRDCRCHDNTPDGGWESTGGVGGKLI